MERPASSGPQDVHTALPEGDADQPGESERTESKPHRNTCSGSCVRRQPGAVETQDLGAVLGDAPELVAAGHTFVDRGFAATSLSEHAAAWFGANLSVIAIPVGVKVFDYREYFDEEQEIILRAGCEFTIRRVRRWTNALRRSARWRRSSGAALAHQRQVQVPTP